MDKVNFVQNYIVDINKIILYENNKLNNPKQQLKATLRTKIVLFKTGNMLFTIQLR